ncbi:hypothetical protein [Labrys neptuniae]
MSRNCYFAISHGLSGCYMPDTVHHYRATTRGEIADILRDAIEFEEMPKALIREVKLMRLWSHAKRHGTSSVHFSISHKGRSIGFHGLTKAEFVAAEEAADW